MPPELDIVVWAVEGKSASEVSRRSQAFFRACARRGVHLALAELPASLLKPGWRGLRWDRQRISCLRSCLMKPEHLGFLPRLWEVLDRAAEEVLSDAHP